MALENSQCICVGAKYEADLSGLELSQFPVLIFVLPRHSLKLNSCEEGFITTGGGLELINDPASGRGGCLLFIHTACGNIEFHFSLYFKSVGTENLIIRKKKI